MTCGPRAAGRSSTPLPGLTGGTQYDLQIRAVNAVGDGPWSATATGTTTATGTPTTDTDRDILIALYNATDGPNWNNNTNWLSDGAARQLARRHDGCGWAGCDPGSHGEPVERENAEPAGRPIVRSANCDWQNNHLSGPIPSELGRLSALTRLDLENNDLSGPIPSQLGGMSNLGVLLLGDNNFDGSLPAQLGNLDKLSYLRIRNNDLTGPIPPELGRLENLHSPVCQR